MVPVAIAQFAPTADKQANLRVIAELADTAAADGARVLALPEYAMFTVPTMTDEFVTTAEPLDGEFVSSLGELVRQDGLHIVAGINEAIPGEDRIHNTLIALGPDGRLVAKYRKLHLYDAFGYRESDRVAPGEIEAPETFTVDGVTFGLQTCYDLRFPETTRRLVDAGADVVVVPAFWARGPQKERHWTTLVTARAIESTIHVVAVDQAPPLSVGCSMVVDPMGVALAALGDDDGIAIARIDPAVTAATRERNPSLANRRYRIR